MKFNRVTYIISVCFSARCVLLVSQVVDLIIISAVIVGLEKVGSNKLIRVVGIVSSTATGFISSYVKFGSKYDNRAFGNILKYRIVNY